jgi:hypothetical protein
MESVILDLRREEEKMKGLSILARGVYMVMLDTYLSEERPFKGQALDIASQLGLPEDEVPVVAEVLKRYYHLSDEDGCWHCQEYDGWIKNQNLL